MNALFRLHGLLVNVTHALTVRAYECFTAGKRTEKKFYILAARIAAALQKTAFAALVRVVEGRG